MEILLIRRKTAFVSFDSSFNRSMIPDYHRLLSIPYWFSSRSILIVEEITKPKAFRGEEAIERSSAIPPFLHPSQFGFTGRCSSRRRSRWGRRTERRIWTPCRCKSQSLDPGSTCRIERSLASPGFCSSPNRSSSVSVQRITIGDE